jgi:hypothetical protein
MELSLIFVGMSEYMHAAQKKPRCFKRLVVTILNSTHLHKFKTTIKLGIRAYSPSPGDRPRVSILKFSGRAGLVYHAVLNCTHFLGYIFFDLF